MDTITRQAKPDISKPAPEITMDHPDFERLNKRMRNLHRDYPAEWAVTKALKLTTHPSKRKKKLPVLIPVIDIAAHTTNSVEFAYKTFRFSALDLLQSVKHSGITPAAFYRDYGTVLRSLAREACQKCGVDFEEFRAFTQANTPKMAHVFEEQAKPSTPETSGANSEPETVAELQKKLERAIKRRDKAQREIDELDLQITAMLSSKSVEEVREVFYPSEAAEPTPAQDEPERSLRATRRRQRVERQRAKRARQSRRSEQQQAA